MRLTILAAAALLAAGCATRPKPPPACPAPNPAQEADILFPAVARAFGGGKGSWQIRVESRTTDARGRHVLQLKDIQPATAEPTPGGARATLVLERCTWRVVKLTREPA